MPKRTPIEQAIAEQTDRRAVYVRRMREKGNRQIACWVPVSAAEEFKDLAGALIHCDDPSAYAVAISDLTAVIIAAGRKS
ncbi:hypothetical protein [Novosphingobium sp. P6W]|uniref:hypothetical protein n=1 Tax=Novosphingobium sp. P6W TaxID=1609758 RepID=UPI0013B3D2B6|nr:hypothetical protein [Novosphingobium sp. P6W]